MFDKWKVIIAGLMVGVLLGWGAWNFTRQNNTEVALANIAPAPDSSAPLTSTATPGFVPPGSAPSGYPAPSGFMPPNATAHLIGKPLPSWNFPATAWTNTSKPVSLESLRGSVTLVEVFRINCSHCQQAAPFMYAMQQNYIPRGLKIISIQSPVQSNPEENDWKKVQYVVKDLWKLTYPVAFDANSKYLQKLYLNNRDNMRWPTTLLLDRKGVVVYGHTGHREVLSMRLYQEIQAQLAKK
jgi:thiol-disulfide isomerase/thioredoxin